MISRIMQKKKQVYFAFKLKTFLCLTMRNPNAMVFPLNDIKFKYDWFIVNSFSKSSFSQYFDTLFTEPLQEQHQGIHVDLPQIFELLLFWIHEILHSLDSFCKAF